MTIKRRNKLPKRLKERCKKLRIRITKVRNGKRIYKTKKDILEECKKKLKKNKFGTKRRRVGPRSMSYYNKEGVRFFPIEMVDEYIDEDEAEDAVSAEEYTNKNYIYLSRQNDNNGTEQIFNTGDEELYNLSNENNAHYNLNILSQGMKAIDIMHDVKNNFQRGVGAVRNFLKGDSNGNIFDMNSFINIFNTFDYKSEKKVIAAYLRNNSILNNKNIDLRNHIGTHNYIVVDGVIQDNKGVQTFNISCPLCERTYNLPSRYLRNNNAIKTFKVIQTILFLKKNYANDIVGNVITRGGLVFAPRSNLLAKYTKNLLHACITNTGLNNNNFRDYFENSDSHENYTSNRANHQRHFLQKIS